MSFTRRVNRAFVAIGPLEPTKPSPPGHQSDEITYRGYRIEPESYAVTSTAWSPRVVVSLKTDEGWSRRAPMYSTSAAKFPTRNEADRRAVDVARAWIDTAVEQRQG